MIQNRIGVGAAISISTGTMSNTHCCRIPPDKGIHPIHKQFGSPKLTSELLTKARNHTRKRARKKIPPKESPTYPGCPTIYAQVPLNTLQSSSWSVSLLYVFSNSFLLLRRRTC